MVARGRGGGERRDVDCIERFQAALRADFEPANRFDRVAEELDPHRVEPVGRKHVEKPPRGENSPGSSTALVF